MYRLLQSLLSPNKQTEATSVLVFLFFSQSQTHKNLQYYFYTTTVQQFFYADF